MNNFHKLHDELRFAPALRPALNSLSEPSSRAATLLVAFPTSHQHSLQAAPVQPPHRKTTHQFLINGPAIRNHRKPLKTNNRTVF